MDSLIQQFTNSLGQLMHEPKHDIEKNIRAFVSECISQLDLVTREELSQCEAQLLQAEATLATLQQQFATLTSAAKD